MSLAGASVRGSVSHGGSDGDRRPRILVRYASDMSRCSGCEEPWCDEHGEHYGECSCVGPHQDDSYDYEYDGDKLYAVEKRL